MRVSAVRTVAAVIALTALVCVVAAAGDGPIGERPPPSVTTGSDSAIPDELPADVLPAKPYRRDPPGSPAWLWWLLGALAAGAVVWGAVRIIREPIQWRVPRLRWRWRWRWRARARAAREVPPRPDPAPVAHDDEAQAAREAVDAALAPLREPADPRGAVIEAYARMEHVLAQRQLGRQTAEAPREYLRRVMREQGMPAESLTTLTALFEEARFSRHPIPASAPRRAARELESARAALAAASHAARTV